MRHLNSGNKLSLNSAHRKSMMRNLVKSLMEHGQIRTTEARAKQLRGYADRVITLSKRVPHRSLAGLEGQALSDALARRVHAIRQARLLVDDRDVLKKIFSEYSDRYETRPGGYTRIYKLGRRPGDQADMVLIALVTEDYTPKAPTETTGDSASV